MEKIGKLGIFRPNFIMAINLLKIKAAPPPEPLRSLFVVLIHITLRLAALFDCLGEETWPKLQMHKPVTPLTPDLGA
ncbi:uncharacterized [Tachysurus ichikawai]